MAELGDRGQMLLIGAVVLAVTFVSLAIVLNGSINTTTVASEASADVSERETIALQQDVRRDVGGLIGSAIAEHPHSYSDQRDYVVADTGPELTDRYRRYHAGADRLVTVDGFSAIAGDRVYDDDQTTTFEYSGSTSWDVTTSASHVRNFVVDVHGLTGTFSVILTDGGETVQIDVFESGGDTVVEVDGQQCRSASTTPAIAITEAKLDGDRCDPLDVFERFDGKYDVEFVGADQITGEYDVLLSDGGQGHNVEGRLYGVRVDVEERSPSVAYESTIRVAPGEPR